MKKMLILLVLLVSFAASAQEVSYLVKNPNINGFYFSDSNQHGLCVALGYRKAVLGSYSWAKLQDLTGEESEGKEITIGVNEYGKVIKGRVTTNYISEIICLDKQTYKAEELPVSIKYNKENHTLVHPNSHVPFGIEHNSADGICAVLGYKKAVMGAFKIGTQEERIVMVSVNSQGIISKGYQSKDFVKEIVCIEEQ